MADDFIPSSQIPGLLAPGTEGRVTGLVNAAQLNGLSALVIEHDAATGRYKVLCENDQNVALKPENFLVSPEAQTADARRESGRNNTNTGDNGDIDDNTSLASNRDVVRVSLSNNNNNNNPDVLGRTSSAAGPGSRLSGRGPSVNNTYVPPPRRSDTKWYEETVLYEYFPVATYTTTGCLVWLALLTIILLFAPR